MRAALRAVAPDAEEQIDALALQEIDDHGGILRPARRAQHRAALVVDPFHVFGRQQQRPRPLRRIQPLVAIADAQHGRHAVAMVELQEDRTDDVVQAGAKAAAGDNSRLAAARVEEDLFPRTGLFDRQFRAKGPAALRFNPVKHPRIIRHEVAQAVAANGGES